MNRIKHKNVIDSRLALDDVLGEIRELTIRRNRVQLDRDDAVKAIDDRISPVLTELDTALAARTEHVRVWAEANEAEFGKLKSLDTPHAVIGWRVGNPTVKPLRGQTVESVIELLQRLPEFGAAFLRHKVELAKEAILAARARLGDDGLKRLGLRVTQTESFFIDPKIEQPENRQTSAA